MRRTITAGLLLMLAGFAPPDRPPASLEPTQQQAIPKSWVPETKPDQAPPITLDVTPRAPSAYTHGRDLVCEPVSGPRGVPKEFVDAYQAARVAIQIISSPKRFVRWSWPRPMRETPASG